MCSCDKKYGNLAFGENSRALRLENVLLRKPLSDLRAANANPIVRRAHEMGSRRVGRKRTGTSFEVPVLFLVTRTGIEPMFPA